MVLNGSAAAPNDTALQHITEEIYRKNYELSLRNKVLNTLRVLYPIALRSMDIEQLSQQIVDKTAEQLSLPLVVLFGMTPDRTNLKLYAAHFGLPQKEIDELLHISYKDWMIPLSVAENVLVKSYTEEKSSVDQELPQILASFLDPQTAQKLAEALRIESVVIHPLSFGKNMSGMLVIGFSKQTTELSRLEKDAVAEVVGLIRLSMDRAQLYNDLEIANKHLEELDKLKDEFLSIASHDLRTPMTAMKGYLYLILKRVDELPVSMRGQMQRIYACSERLIALINDMLDVSRIESGRMQMIMEKINLLQITHDVIEELHILSNERGITVTLSDDTPFFVTADQNRVHEVLINLIGNAVKFTPENGTITVTFKEEGNEIKTMITDTGIGIKKEDIPKLFLKFGRVDTSDTFLPNVAGTGLGLFICKKIIELSGGTVGVTSQEGKGSTFYFTLPKYK